MQGLSLQQAMVKGQLMPVGVSNPGILDAMSAIKREMFLQGETDGLCYSDAVIVLPNGRALMPPIILGRLLQAAGLEPEDKILIVGGATGYSAAVASGLVSRVVLLEPDRGLLDHAKSSIAQLNMGNVECLCQPLEEGASLLAPYDCILVEGGFRKLPEALADQLAPGGAVLGVRLGERQYGGTAVRIEMEEGAQVSEDLFDVEVPELPWQGKGNEAFVF